jgi:hypothetical protein
MVASLLPRPRKHGLELSWGVTTAQREPQVERREASAPWPGCALCRKVQQVRPGFLGVLPSFYCRKRVEKILLNPGYGLCRVRS